MSIMIVKNTVLFIRCYESGLYVMELSENKNTEMFKKNLKTKKDQDQTTDKLSFTFVSASEKVSDNNSDNGDNHSCGFQ